MITEDYVSFETAKLLKEKGFDEQCTYMYDSQHKLYSTFEQCRQITRNNSDWIYYVGKLNVVPIAVPTLQMAMKWVRKEHNIHIEVGLQEHINENRFLYRVKIFDPTNLTWKLNAIVHNWDSYEEACEAAIKYCLTNLI